MPEFGIFPRRKDWIVVANEAAAVVYTRDKKYSPLEEILTFKNDVARVKTADLISDRGGRAFDSHGQGRHAMEKSDPKRQAMEVFARKLAGRIGKALHDGRCSAYALVAAPRFLGMLRKEAATNGLPEPFASIAKDVVGRDSETIRKLLT